MGMIGSVFNIDTIQESIDIDNFYQKTIKSFSDNIIDLHKAFIRFQKKLFSDIDKDFSMSKTAGDILLKKYEYYTDDMLGMIEKNSNNFYKEVLKYNKHTGSQVKIIKEVLNRPGSNMKYNLPVFRIHKDIWFKTKALGPSAKDITFMYSYGDLSERFEWFDSKESIEKRIEYDKEIYIKEGNKTAQEIVTLYDQYEKDVKEYWKSYIERIEQLRKVLKSYKVDYENKLSEIYKRKLDEDEKMKYINRYKEGIDTSILLMNLIGEHYKKQLKVIIQSMKDMGLVVQNIYDVIMS